MKIKLRKIFNIFHLSNFVPSLFLLVILLSILFAIRAYARSHNLSFDFDTPYKWYSLLLVPAFSLIMCTLFSDYLIIKKRRITYKEFKKVYGKYSYHCFYEVNMEVTNFEFRQNFIERLFNVGHIRFEGYVNSIDPKKVTIYGIPDFDTNKQEIKRYLRNGSPSECL